MHALLGSLTLLSIVSPLALALDSAGDFFHGLPRHAKTHRRVKFDLGSSPTWVLTDSYQGKQFLDGFMFENMTDPTGGRVDYVNKETAVANNLTSYTDDSFIMRADSTTVLDPAGPGRQSIRIKSQKQWTRGIFVLDLNHMPAGCGTWPAFWMTEDIIWPKNGEIDVIEGVNDKIPNRSALHTINNCSIATPANELTGTVASTNCSYLNNFNEGCAITWDRKDSYGPALNAIGGGWFVTERTDSRVSVWFWGRQDANVPPAVKYGLPIMCTKEFGTPVALWESSSTCDLHDVLREHNIIFNLSLCGSWAGQPNVFQGAGCPGTCVDYVNNNPAAFENAFWDIASLKIYSKFG